LLLFDARRLVDGMSRSPSDAAHARRPRCDDDDDGQSVDVVDRRTQRRRVTGGGRSSLTMLVLCLLLITAELRVDAIHWL